MFEKARKNIKNMVLIIRYLGFFSKKVLFFLIFFCSFIQFLHYLCRCKNNLKLYTMKRFIIAIALIFSSIAAVSADERPIEFGQMPKAAINFIKSHFADISVLYANVERDILETDYEVGLADGTRIDFNGSGEWTEVTNKRVGVPSAILPHKITEYIKANYPDTHYLKIERSSRKYEVKLTNGMEILFSLDGKLIGFDD